MAFAAGLMNAGPFAHGVAGDFADNARMRLMSSLLERLQAWITQPGTELTRAQRSARYAVDLATHCARQLRRDNAPQMAAALTYRTIFSLVPTLVLFLLGFQMFYGLEDMRDGIQDRAFKFFGLAALTYDTQDTQAGEKAALSQEAAHQAAVQADPAVPAADAPAPADEVAASDTATDTAGNGAVNAQSQLRASISWVLNDLTTKLAEKRDEVSFKSIGVVGGTLLVWAALALAVTVEGAFNRIYNCPTGRSWVRRITVYWAVLTLSPLLVGISLYVVGQVKNITQPTSEQSDPVISPDVVASASAASNPVRSESTLDPVSQGASTTQRLTATGEGVVGDLLAFLSRFTSFLMSWMLFGLLYLLMPNTKVKLKAALIGSLVAAVLWELAKWGMGLYVTKTVPFAKVYGALGLIPLFLFWLYVTWLIVLFGLELTHALQVVNEGRLRRQEVENDSDQLCDPGCVLPLMVQLTQAFDGGRACNIEELADRLRLPQRTVDRLLAALRGAHLVHEVERDDEPAYALARSPGKIAVADLLDVAEQIGHEQRQRTAQEAGNPGWRLLDELHAARRAAAAERSLAEVARS